MKSILFVGYGEPEPSSRYRAEQYYQEIKKKFHGKILVEYYVIHPQSSIAKQYFAFFLLGMLIRKVLSLVRCVRFDIVFLQRNPVMICSPFYEFFIKYVLRKKLIFDFDDSLWILKGRYDRRIEQVIKLSDLVIVGNKFLRDYAIKFNRNIFVLNTVIDTGKNRRVVRNQRQSTCTNICWIGSRSTNPYIVGIEDVLTAVKLKHGDRVNYLIVSDEKPRFESFADYQFFVWSRQTQFEVLCSSDIGIMPLIDSEIAKGKCGFKLIQYGAYSLALIASPIGINKEIVRNGINGYLTESKEEWVAAISDLVENGEMMETMKKQAREIISSEYSLESRFNDLMRIIESVCR